MAVLTDPQGRRIDYVRLSVTDRCNYRCTYCMPESGIDHIDRADILSFEEILAIVRCFASLGVRRLRITGGEPTVRRDLCDLVRRLRAVPGIDELSLSTNGHLLAELAAPLRAAGIARLNVSLDTLDADKFARITRRGDVARVRAGIEAARAAGFAVIKINTVAVKGFNDGEIGALCDFAWSRGLIPRFIEQMPMAGGEMFVPGELLSAQEIRDLVAAAWPGGASRRRRGRRRARRRPGALLAPGRAGCGWSRAAFRHHLGDDRALLRRLQPRAPVGVGRAARVPGLRRRGQPARRAARRRRGGGDRGDPSRGLGEAARAHLRPARDRRAAQIDDLHRRVSKKDEQRMSMNVSRVRARIGELRGEFEDRLAALVEVPTVSMDPGRRGDMDRCAALASEYLRAIGARVDADRHRRVPDGRRVASSAIPRSPR